MVTFFGSNSAAAGPHGAPSIRASMQCMVMVRDRRPALIRTRDAEHLSPLFDRSCWTSAM